MLYLLPCWWCMLHRQSCRNTPSYFLQDTCVVALLPRTSEAASGQESVGRRRGQERGRPGRRRSSRGTLQCTRLRATTAEQGTATRSEEQSRSDSGSLGLSSNEPPAPVCVKIASCLRRDVQPVSKAEESQMSRITSALPVSARLKRNCVNANEGAGASGGAIIPVTPSPSREAAPSVSFFMAEGVEV